MNPTFEELYPFEYQQSQKGSYFWTPGSYQPILDSFGKIVLQVNDDDYQGDSRVLYKRNGKYGLLIFGWGSCSGCDALQACDSPEEVMSLANELRDQIRWLPKDEMLNYFKTHDWKGDFSWSQDETKDFVEKAIGLLGEVNQ